MFRRLPNRRDVESALEALRGARARTLELAGSASQSQLDQRPTAERWSAGEVLDHLILAEGFHREEVGRLLALARSGKPAILRRSFAEVDASLAFIPKPLLPFLDLPFTVMNLFVPTSIRDALISSRLVPARNPTFATPRPGRPAAELRAELSHSLVATEQLVTKNTDLDFRQLVHEHPLLGRNDGLGILRLMANHERRHHAQLAEALETATAQGTDEATGFEAAEKFLRPALWRETRRQTLALVENLSQEQADRRAQPEKWSVGEVLDHLVRTEKYFANELTVLIEQAANGGSKRLERSFTEVAGSLFYLPPLATRLLEGPLTALNNVLPHEARRRILLSRMLVVQSPKSLEPARGRDLAVLRSELRNMSGTEALVERVGSQPRLPYDELQLTHPILGRHQGLRQVFDQAAAHEERHQAQIRGILTGLAARGSG